MDTHIDLSINRLIQIIKQLPADKKILIKRELEKEDIQDKKNIAKTGLKELLLAGPTITTEEEENFTYLSKAFDQWTKLLFV